MISFTDRQKQLLLKQRLGQYIVTFMVLKNLSFDDMHPHVLTMLDHWSAKKKGRPASNRSTYNETEISVLSKLTNLKLSDIHPSKINLDQFNDESHIQLPEDMILKNHIFCIPLVDKGVKYFRTPYGDHLLSLYKSTLDKGGLTMMTDAVTKYTETVTNQTWLRDMVDNISVFKIAHVKKYNNEYTLKFDKKLKIPSLIITCNESSVIPYRGDYIFIGNDNSIFIEKETGLHSTDYGYVGRGK